MTTTGGTATERRGGVVCRTTDEMRDLVAALEATTLPPSRWTHAAHLTAALWYLVWYGPDDALDRVRSTIRRYNAAHPDVPMAVGYHETMTRFWMWVVRDYVRRAPLEGSLADLARDLVAARADRDLVFMYYSRDRIMSDRARGAWVEPDIRPLS